MHCDIVVNTKSGDCSASHAVHCSMSALIRACNLLTSLLALLEIAQHISLISKNLFKTFAYDFKSDWIQILC